MTQPSRSEATMDYRQVILDAAVRLSLRDSVQTLTRDGVAIEASVGAGTVNRYFATIAGLREAVFCEAVTKEILPLIAQGVVVGFMWPPGVPLPPELRQRALEAVA